MFIFDENAFRNSVKGYNPVNLIVLYDEIERGAKRYEEKTDVDSVKRYQAAVRKLQIITELLNDDAR